MRGRIRFRRGQWLWSCSPCSQLEWRLQWRQVKVFGWPWMGFAESAADAVDAYLTHLHTYAPSTIPRGLRESLIDSFGGACAECGDEPTRPEREHVALANGDAEWVGTGRRESALEIDHIVPRRFGGTNAAHNLQPLCTQCHHTKTAQEHAEAAARRRTRQSPLWTPDRIAKKQEAATR